MKIILGLLMLAVLASAGSVLAGVPARRVIDAGLVAGLAVIVSILGGAILGDLNWRLDVLGQFLLLAPIAAAAIAAFSFGTGRKSVAAYAGVAFALASAMAVPWLASPPSAPPHAPHFSLLLFNVWSKNKQAAEVRDLVEKADADVVVLVETSPRMSAALHDLSDRYPYRYECVGMEDCDILLFAKVKLDAPQARPLRDEGNAYIASTQMEIAGCRLTLFATHMGHPGPTQLLQARNIAQAVAGVSGVRLLAGDFNGVPWGANVQTIAKFARLTLAEGIGGTFPSRLMSFLALPIDHLLTSRGIEVTERRVMPSAGSDHLPVLLGVSIVDRSACLNVATKH